MSPNQTEIDNSASSLSAFEALGFKKVTGALNPPPLEKPPFTLKQIRDVIPAHCFDRSLLRSMAHLTFDLVVISTLYYLSTFIPLIANPLLQLPFWLLYFGLQGLFLMALMVIGHEAGHGSLSTYPMANEVMGWIAYSLVLTPQSYAQAGHRGHHQFANSCEHDEFFVRPTRSQAMEEEKDGQEWIPKMDVFTRWLHVLEEIPLYNLICAIGESFSFYSQLVRGKCRLEKFKGRKNFGFWIDAEIYAPHNQQYKIPLLVSYLGCLIVISGHLGHRVYHGAVSYLLHIGIPMLVMFTIFALMTFLHHTDVYIPRYRDPEWSWLRGALSTVDRSYGTFFNFVTHHGGDTHVVHHLFPKMPFYHTVEATEAIKGVLGKYYLRDDTPMFTAAMRVHQNCKFIEDKGSVVFSKKNLGKN